MAGVLCHVGHGTSHHNNVAYPFHYTHSYFTKKVDPKISHMAIHGDAVNNIHLMMSIVHFIRESHNEWDNMSI